MLPSVSRRSSAGVIARHSRGNAVIERAVEMMITSWTASDGSTNSKKAGVEKTAKPKPVNV
jgi:hypothetical protein